MGSRSADKIRFTSFDDLFGQAPGKEEGENKIVRVLLTELHPSKNHPFRVIDDEKMEETVRSIKQYGVLVPGIVRRDQQGGYEIIAGHRRKRGSELAGCPDMPVIIRNLTDDEAVIVMVDSNIQREDILPSEKAWAYRMKMEALSHQGVKGEQFTAELVGEASGESGRTVQRYIRLTYLNAELLEYVDKGKISLVTGEKISFLTAEEQGWVLNTVKDKESFPGNGQAKMLKEESQKGTLTESQVKIILSKVVKSTDVTISAKRIREYFPPDYTKEQVESVIFELLDSWRESQKQVVG